ncbi:ATP-binding protein [Zoogloeaceae bacteirum Par-f-2]|nr:ATP-binding protein [Zoogloeaceae bacteirum Par-f-2]
MKPQPLARSLFVRYLLVAIVTFALVYPMIVGWLIPQVSREIEQRQIQLGQAIVGQVQAQLAGPAFALEGISRALEAKPALAGDALEALLDGFLAQAGGFSSLYLLDPAGRVMAVGLPPARRELRADLLGLDFSRHPLWRIAHESASTHWTDRFLSAVDGGFTVAAARAAGAWTLIGELAFDPLVGRLKAVSAGGDLRTLLLDRRGRTLADSQRELPERLEDFGNYEFMRAPQRFVDQVLRFDFEGQPMLGMVAQVPELGWRVLVMRSAVSAYRPVRTASLILLGGLAVAVGIGLFGAALQARYFARMFARLSAFAGEVGRGHYELVWTPARIREVNALAAAVERMGRTVQGREAALAHSEARLRELNETLEQRVAERTAALERSNRELADALAHLRLAQDELLRTERLAALGALVAGVAHELSTPLGNSLMAANTVGDRTRALKRDLQTGLKRSTLDQYLADTEAGAAIIERNLQRAADLVASFRQVAVDRASSQRRRFALDEVVDELALTLRPSFKRQPWKLETDVAPGLELDSYPGPLGQVLTNLVNNAIVHGFAGRDHGTVTVRGRADGADAVLLEVTDDGCGISAEHLRRIFDPFFTTRLGQGGSGLGLHIVHNVVSDLLGGTVEVDSRPGEGTRMRVRIPRRAPDGPPSAGADTLDQRGG